VRVRRDARAAGATHGIPVVDFPDRRGTGLTAVDQCDKRDAPVYAQCVRPRGILFARGVRRPRCYRHAAATGDPTIRRSVVVGTLL